MNICYSGGARGADKLWGELAKKAGHDVCHFTFKGHGAAKWATGRSLTEEELQEADRFLKRANKSLKRPDPLGRSSQFVVNLLRRNYWQVCDTESVYAIAHLDGDWKVHGGTAWAVQMFIDRMMDHYEAEWTFGFNEIPLYVFDQGTESWYNFDLNHGFGKINKPPVPSGPWTGIGSRELTEAATNAIEQVFVS